MAQLPQPLTAAKDHINCEGEKQRGAIKHTDRKKQKFRAGKGH